jgi:DNA-directed RNA polymerase III subunit RPC8
MFVLSRLTDVVKLLPSTEYSPEALTQWLNAKYANKVLHQVGLCIAVYDILSVGDGAIKHGDGCVYIQSSFAPPPPLAFACTCVLMAC